MDRHFHWTIGAYDKMVDDTHYDKMVQVTVIGPQNEEDALIEVQAILARKHYVLLSVYECNTCKYQSQLNKTMKDMADKI